MSDPKVSRQGQGGGRPQHFKSAEDLQASVDAYFDQFEDSDEEGHPKKGKAPNLFGLSLYLGMSYDSLIEYENGERDTETEKLSVPLIAARLKCLEYAGERAFTHTAGAVLVGTNLTRKFKEPWKNAQHQDLNVTGSLDVTDRLKEARERITGA